MTEIKLEDYKQKLIADFPNLQIGSIKFIGSGWHHDAIEATRQQLLQRNILKTQ